MRSYYPIPAPFGRLTAGEPSKKVSLVESIQQHIYCMLTAHLGEYRYDPGFGCIVWEHDFETVSSFSSWQNRIEESIKALVGSQEPRLTDTQIRVGIEEEEWKRTEEYEQIQQYRIRRKIKVSVSGKLKLTNERVDYPDFVLFFSPVSLD